MLICPVIAATPVNVYFRVPTGKNITFPKKWQ